MAWVAFHGHSQCPAVSPVNCRCVTRQFHPCRVAKDQRTDLRTFIELVRLARFLAASRRMVHSRLIVAACALAGVSFLEPLAHAAALAPQPKPNVIFILTDDQGWGDTKFN